MPKLTIDDPKAHEAKVERMITKIRYYHRLGKGASKNGLTIKEYAEEHQLGEMTMRQARAFAELYRTRKDLDELCNLRRPNGLPLQWGYIPYLLTVKDRGVRTELQRRAAREGWSAAELYVEINLRRGKPKSFGGRPIKKPRSPTACLLQIVTDGRPWIRRCQAISNALGAMRPRPSKKHAQKATEVLLELAQLAGALAKQVEQKWA